MFKSRRSLSLLLMMLVVLSTSVFLSPQKVSAQTTLPLPVAQEVIEQQKQELEKKESILVGSEQEIENLLSKRISLATELKTIKKDLKKLKDQVAEKKAAAAREKKRVEQLRNMFVHINRYGVDSAGNTYAAGNCTWYAKSRRPDLPNNLGNANTWYSRAKSQGWNVGSAAKKGAIGTTTAGWAGHVVYVEGVSLDGKTVVISEMNYEGLGVVSTRTVHYSEFYYIYELD